MLKVDNLTFEVNEEGRKRCLVNHVSFQVADGEMLVITGPNGGGKSTLAKVLAGIEKADEGRIFLDEEDISGYDIDHRANAGIGYAFQQPPRFKGMTHWQNLYSTPTKGRKEVFSWRMYLYPKTYPKSKQKSLSI